jgi:hypothetical protein
MALVEVGTNAVHVQKEVIIHSNWTEWHIIRFSGFKCVGQSEVSSYTTLKVMGNHAATKWTSNTPGVQNTT